MVILSCLSLSLAAAPPKLSVFTWTSLGPRQDQACPLTADITSDVPFQGWLQADFGATSDTPFRQRVDIPPGTFRFHLYPVFRDPQDPDLRVVLLDHDGGQLHAETFLYPEPEADWIIGSIGARSRRLSLAQLAPLLLDDLAAARLAGPLIANGREAIVIDPEDPAFSLAATGNRRQVLDQAHQLRRQGDPLAAIHVLQTVARGPDDDLAREHAELVRTCRDDLARDFIRQFRGPKDETIATHPVVRRCQLVNLADTEHLPDRWYGYQPLDAVWWDTDTVPDLPGPARRALLAWVRQGGHLVLAIAPETATWHPPLNLPGLDPDQPGTVVPCGFGSVAIFRGTPDQLAAWPRDRLLALLGCPPDVDIRRDDVLAAAKAVNELVIFIKRSASHGNVSSRLDMTAFDNLDLDPLPEGTWLAWQAIASELLSCRACNSNVLAANYLHLRPGSGYLPSELASLTGRLGFPLATLVWLGLAYGLAISLLDWFFIARRLRRPLLTWLTWPLLVVLFGAAFYRLFNPARDSLDSSYETTIVDLDEAAGVARTATVGVVRLAGRNARPIPIPADNACWQPAWETSGTTLARTSATADAIAPGGVIGGFAFHCQQGSATVAQLPCRLVVDPHDQPRLEPAVTTSPVGGYLVLGQQAWYINDRWHLTPSPRAGNATDYPFTGYAPPPLSQSPFCQAFAREAAMAALPDWWAGDSGRQPLWHRLRGMGNDFNAALPTPSMLPMPPPRWATAGPDQARIVLFFDNPDGKGLPRCVRLLAIAHREPTP